MNSRTVKSEGKWHLIYHPTLDGRHSFTIERITHRKELYDGISIENALKRFNEVVKEQFGVDFGAEE